jgi:hypothetical protein
MAIDVQQAIEYDLDQSAPASVSSSARGPFLALAIFDGSQWASLCPELDVASVGSSADTALSGVADAAAEVLRVADAEGLPARTPASESDVREFLLTHQGAHAVSGRHFFV